MGNSAYINAPTSFAKAQDVVNIQNAVLKSISGNISASNLEGKTLLERIKEKEIIELETLKGDLIKKEAALYASLGIDNYKSLYYKTIQWKNSGAASILQNPILIKEIQEVFEEILLSNLEEVVLNFTKEGFSTPEFRRLIGDEALELIPDGATLIGGSLKGGSQTTGRKGTLTVSFNVPKIDSANWEQKGEFLESKKYKGITFFRSKRQNKIEVRFTQDLSQKFQSEFSQHFKKFVSEQQELNLKTASDRNAIIKQKILSFLPPGRYPLANASIDKIISKFLVEAQEIGISKTSSGIRGALGEIYWNAFFDFLGIRAIPAGLTRLTTKSKEPPIDIIFKSFGFQVKNYTVNDGVVTFNSHFDKELKERVPNHQPLGTFFARGLDLGEGAREQFGKFYFSSNYNLPNEDYKSNDSYENYKNIFERFNSIYNGINSYIESNLDKLLNINKNIQFKEPELFDENLEAGKPVMFFINENPYPASEMIQDIINGLRDNFTGSVNIEIKNLKLDLSPFNVDKTWPNMPSDTDISGRIKQAQAYYTIDVQVNNLLQQILQRIPS